MQSTSTTTGAQSRRLLAAAVACALAIAAAARAGEHGGSLDAALATITAEELREHAGLLADDTLEGRAAGSRGGRAAARYIEERLKSAGLPPAGDGGGYVQRFGASYANVIARAPGYDPEMKDEVILIGAHYDHVGYGSQRNSNGPVGYIHNGADDNASGVATLLEMIDALARTGRQSRRSLVFAFWDGEEINLLGSRHWVRHPTVPLPNVRLAVNADMVGRMTNGRLEVAGTRTADGLRRMFSSSRLPAGMWLDFSWEYEENSDHWPFYEAGVPSLLVHTGIHADYHRPSDDVEKLNVRGMRDVAAYLLEAVCRAADADELPRFRVAARSENAATRRRREAPLAAAAPRLGLRWSWKPDDASPPMVVRSVTPGSPADQAGIRPGDRLQAVDGVAIDAEAILPAAVLRARADIELALLRGDEPPQAVRVALAGAPVELGLAWREDDAAPGAVFVTRVTPFSPAARAGINVLDRIYSVNGEPFTDQDQLLARISALLAEKPNSLHLELETAGRIRNVAVDLGLPTQPEDPSL